MSAVEPLSGHIFSDDTFGSLGLDERLEAHLVDKEGTGLGLSNPTQVQRKAIPAILAGQDIMVKSETGSGKTLSYLLPVLQGLLEEPNRVARAGGTRAIVILPTRELANQVLSVLAKLVRRFPYVVAGNVTGGEKRKSEKARLRKGITILVATPGRLLDHLEKTASFDVTLLRWLVLDEADRLLDLGFEQQLSKILAALRSRAAKPFQGVLLSATQGVGIDRLACLSLRKPVFIDVAAASYAGGAAGAAGDNMAGGARASGETFAADTAAAGASLLVPRQLSQHVVVVPTEKRLVVLSTLLANVMV
eukprot:g4808.t1